MIGPESLMLQLEGDCKIDMRKDFGVSFSDSFLRSMITYQTPSRKEEVAATTRTSLIIYIT